MKKNEQVLPVCACRLFTTLTCSYVRLNDLLLILVFSDELLPGWYIGVSTMRRGEKSKFLLAPEYAFKDLGSPPRVPPSATGLCLYTCSSKLKRTGVFFCIVDAIYSECFNQ